jgi:flagellin-specific chaperone FliS
MIRRAVQAYAKNDVDLSVASSNSVQLILLVYGKLLDHLRVAKVQLKRAIMQSSAFQNHMILFSRAY